MDAYTVLLMSKGDDQTDSLSDATRDNEDASFGQIDSGRCLEKAREAHLTIAI